MTTINTIEDLARILQDQPTWAEALRALLLTQELLDLPGRFDRFVQIQQETNLLTDQRLYAIDGRLDKMDGRLDKMDGRLDKMDGRLDKMDGRMGNLEGGQYERTVRNKALARSMITLGFQEAYVALAQDVPTDPRLTSAVTHAVRNDPIARDQVAELFETDIIITAADNQHAVIEVSLTADRTDIDRAKTRADILTAVTKGTVTPVAITSKLNPAQAAQAEAAGVTTFVIPYP